MHYLSQNLSLVNEIKKYAFIFFKKIIKMRSIHTKIETNAHNNFL